MKLGQNVEAIVPNIKPLSQALAKLWFACPGDTFRAKNALFGAVFQLYGNTDMYVYLVVFHVAELKNKCFNA